MNDRFKMRLFGRNKRKTLGEIITALIPEDRKSSRTGTIGTLFAMFKNVREQLQVLLHFQGIKSFESECKREGSPIY